MFYKRKTDVANFEPHYYFATKWSNTGGTQSNNPRTDYTMHSTVADAIAGENGYTYYGISYYSYKGPFSTNGPTGAVAYNWAKVEA